MCLSQKASPPNSQPQVCGGPSADVRNIHRLHQRMVVGPASPSPGHRSRDPHLPLLLSVALLPNVCQRACISVSYAILSYA